MKEYATSDLATAAYLHMKGKHVRILARRSKFKSILLILSIGYTCKNVLIILRIASTACM